MRYRRISARQVLGLARCRPKPGWQVSTFPVRVDMNRVVAHRLCVPTEIIDAHGGCQCILTYVAAKPDINKLDLLDQLTIDAHHLGFQRK